MPDDRAAVARSVSPGPLVVVQEIGARTAEPVRGRRPGLAFRLGLLAAALVLGATLFAGFAAIRDERAREAQRRREHLGHVAQLVAEAVTPPAGLDPSDAAWARWTRGERRRLEDAAHQTEIGALFIVGSAGVPVAWGGADGATAALARARQGATGAVIVDAAVPSAPEWRVVAMDLPGERVEATAAVRRMEILSASLGIASGILIFIVVHALVEPVDRMARQAAEAVRSGRPARWEEEGLPEFQELARTLNRLGDAVAQREDLLRRRAEDDIRREQAWARTLVAGSPVGVALLREDDVVIDHNGRAAWAVRPDGHLADVLAAAVRDARPGEPVVVRGPGDRLTRALRVPGRDASHVLFLEDVTEQRRVQSELAAAREQALTGSLAAMVAHEVRNPVHALALHLRLLERAPDEGTRAAAVDYVKGELSVLTGVVDMFLDLARMDAARLEDVDAAAVVDAVLARLRPVWAGVRMVREGEGPRPARLDPRLVEIALGNLVTNACQAMAGAGRGSEVRVEVARRDGGVVLAVEDDGPGIDPALAGRLFEPFVTGRAKGTGLGLAVVRRAAQAHGGEARILLSRTGGARFEMNFPDTPRPQRGERV